MARKLVRKSKDYLYVACPHCKKTIKVRIRVQRGKPQK